MGRIVIACYRPKPDCEDKLHALMADHWLVLRDQDLVTDRASIMMTASDGTVVEVFEWKSLAAIEAAHGSPVVGAMWENYAQVCDYVPVSVLPEAQQLFSSFSPLDPPGH